MKIVSILGSTLYEADLASFLETLERAVAERVDLTGASLTERANLSGLVAPGAKLNESDLRSANLSGANLSGADLQWSVLNYANLRGANLRGADLSWAALEEADFRGADLAEAILKNVTMRESDFRGADMTGASMLGALAGGANFRGADLNSVDMRRAELSGSDLRGAKITEPNVPKIENIREAICEAVVLPGALLASSKSWETFEDHAPDGGAHSLAGWITVLAGEAGAKLERELGTQSAAALIFAASVPNCVIPYFYSNRDQILALIARWQELAQNVVPANQQARDLLDNEDWGRC